MSDIHGYFIQFIGKKQQFDVIFANVVEINNVFTDNFNDFRLERFTVIRAGFYIEEIAIQYIHHRISLLRQGQ